MRIGKKWTALFALACFLIGAVGLGVTLSREPHLGLEDIDLSKTIDAASIGQLSLQTDVSNVVVVPSADSQIHVRYAGRIPASDREYVDIHVMLTGDNASINVSTSKPFQIGLDVSRLSSLFSPSGERTKIELALPAKTFRLLTLSTATGSIDVQYAAAEQLNIETSTGGIRLAGYTGTKADLRTATGRVTVPEAAGSLNVTTNTGSIIVGSSNFHYPMKLKSDTGGIEVTMKAATTLRIDLSSSTGRISVGLPGMVFDTNERHRVIGQTGSGGPLLQASTSTGSITIAEK